MLCYVSSCTNKQGFNLIQCNSTGDELNRRREYFTFHLHFHIAVYNLSISELIKGTFNVILLYVSDSPTDAKLSRDAFSSNGCSQFH